MRACCATASRTRLPPPPQLDRAALLASIRADYAQDYFISGRGDMAGYAPDCTFADPFVSFDGVERFKRNVSNLGGLMREVGRMAWAWHAARAWRRLAWPDACWARRLLMMGGRLACQVPAVLGAAGPGCGPAACSMQSYKGYGR
jgi:hypothetical protein